MSGRNTSESKSEGYSGGAQWNTEDVLQRLRELETCVKILKATGDRDISESKSEDDSEGIAQWNAEDVLQRLSGLEKCVKELKANRTTGHGSNDDHSRVPGFVGDGDDESKEDELSTRMLLPKEDVDELLKGVDKRFDKLEQKLEENIMNQELGNVWQVGSQVLGSIGLCETIFELLFISLLKDLNLFERVFFTYIAVTELIGEVLFLGGLWFCRGEPWILWRMALKDPIHNMAYPLLGIKRSSRSSEIYLSIVRGVSMKALCDYTFMVFCVPLWPQFGDEDRRFRLWTCVIAYVVVVCAAVVESIILLRQVRLGICDTDHAPAHPAISAILLEVALGFNDSNGKSADTTPSSVSDHNREADEEEHNRLETQNPVELQESSSDEEKIPPLIGHILLLATYWYIKVIQVYLLFSRESRLVQGFVGEGLRALQTTEMISAFFALMQPLVDKEFNTKYHSFLL